MGIRNETERTCVLVHLQLSTNHLNLRIRILDILLESDLDILDLLRNGGQNPLLQTIELVETTPSTNLTDTQKDPTHRLEIECVVTAEHERESSELDTQRLD